MLEPDYSKIFDRFSERDYFLSLVYGKIYSESLVTAAWLYDSMKQAQAIDLTVIAMGYFKAAEQFIFSLIRLNDKNYDIIDTSSDSALRILIVSTNPNAENTNISTYKETSKFKLPELSLKEQYEDLFINSLNSMNKSF